ncbi:hypothetical protein EGT07_11320 [Herbaspirillum sp. HC18]|nr:hypothetical protein EGT07_11320 [Herbaspirillum sp. HC18]
MPRLRSAGIIASILLCSTLLGGCTEEKAKALKLSADTFKVEADLACDMGLDSLRQAVAMPKRTKSEIVKNLEATKTFGSAELELIMGDDAFADVAMKPIQEALNQACEGHRALAAIYADLPAGYLLSSGDVIQAQKHVANVTLRFAKLAQIVANNPSVGKENVTRIRIFEAYINAVPVSDATARGKLFDGIAEDILVLQQKETENKRRVAAQFFKAADMGNRLVIISANYDKLSVGDILDTLQSFARIYGEVTSRTLVAQNAANRAKEIENRIQGDPLLKPLLEASLK